MQQDKLYDECMDEFYGEFEQSEAHFTDIMECCSREDIDVETIPDCSNREDFLELASLQRTVNNFERGEYGN